MKVTRRDLLVWSAGAAAGLLATPVPWKILDDVSIWSQNWPWIPQPAKGPIEVRQSACTLCPKGCGLRVRMAGGWAVGVSGVNTHPVSRGALCPLGFAAHQLNWHPQRLRTVRHHGIASSWSEAQAAFAKATSEGPIATIDGYPGRAASLTLETFAQKQGGEYRIVPNEESRALMPYETWSGVPATSLGYDLDHTRTILSFDAPLLDGWDTPGRFTRLWAEHAAGMDDPELRLIQMETQLSRSGARAWRRISIRPGSESALAAGLARVLLEQKLVPARGPIPPMTLSESGSQTGVTMETIRELATTVAAHLPALAIARDCQPAVAALNVVLGAVGTCGGVVRRSKQSQAVLTADAPLANPRAILIDASVPWEFAPQSDAEVFRFAAWDAGSSNAEWLLPAPGFLEDTSDIPATPLSSVESYALAPRLVKAISEVRSAAQFLSTLDSTLSPVDKIIHQRCEALVRARQGTVYGKTAIPIAQFATVQKFEEQLADGAVWVGEPLSPGSLRCELREWPLDTTSIAADNWARKWPTPALPPLAAKLYQESNLREAPDRRHA